MLPGGSRTTCADLLKDKFSRVGSVLYMQTLHNTDNKLIAAEVTVGPACSI